MPAWRSRSCCSAPASRPRSPRSTRTGASTAPASPSPGRRCARSTGSACSIAVIDEGYCYECDADLRRRGQRHPGVAGERPAAGPAHSERRRHSAAGAASDSGRGDARVGRDRAARRQRRRNRADGRCGRGGFHRRHARRYDLVVGADGIHSRTRAMLFPDAPAPAFTGQGCWRAVVPRPAEIDCAHVYVGGPVKAGITPVSRTRCICSCCSTCPDNPRMPEERWPDLLAEQLRGFGGIARRGPRQPRRIRADQLPAAGKAAAAAALASRARDADRRRRARDHAASGVGRGARGRGCAGAGASCLTSGTALERCAAAVHGAALRALPHGGRELGAARRAGDAARAGAASRRSCSARRCWR